MFDYEIVVFFFIYFIHRFVDEARTLEGNAYSPSSLTWLIAGIQRFGRDILKINEFKLFEKSYSLFATLRDSLDRRRKSLFASGEGHIVRHKDEITVHEEQLLWDKGIFNTNTAAGLLNAV